MRAEMIWLDEVSYLCPRYWLADPWAHLKAFERMAYHSIYSRNVQTWEPMK